MPRFLVTLLLVFAACLVAKDDPTVFKSDVALTRVDAQVVDADGRAVTGLQVGDFVLRVDGHVLPIRNFASENMPIDILLLVDVSASMEPHVRRIAAAAQQALNVLAERDRVAVMVFDTSTRVRLPFQNSHDEVTSELRNILRSESFSRGTRITHALMDASRYLQREARPEARRAIVILTDDQTQDEEDEARVEAALSRANAVLSFLRAPYEVPQMSGGGRRRGTWGGGGGGWPGSGGGIGFPGGGPIILGRRGQGPYGGGDHSHSAGTANIAADSGGDTMQVDEASALEDTLARLRQRYALHFYWPEGSTSDQRTVQVDLSQEARIRYRGAEVRYRRVYILGGGAADRTGPTVTRTQEPSGSGVGPPASAGTQDIGSQPQPGKRRVAVDEDAGPRVNTVDNDPGGSSQPASPPASQPTQPSPQDAPAQAQPQQHGGWPRVK
jgi:hypothetical protein